MEHNDRLVNWGDISTNTLKVFCSIYNEKLAKGTSPVTGVSREEIFAVGQANFSNATLSRSLKILLDKSLIAEGAKRVRPGKGGWEKTYYLTDIGIENLNEIGRARQERLDIINGGNK